ncbi:MAG: DUF6044 family protein [Luteibaculum sp.]
MNRLKFDSPFWVSPFGWMFFGLSIVFLWSFVPGYLPNTTFLIHDNLESNVVWAIDIAERSSFFAAWDSPVNAAMGGVKRYCYPSEFYLFTLLIKVFGAKVGYIFNYTLLHVVAYCGAYGLIWVITKSKFLAFLSALYFAFVPFWPPASLSAAGLPLLLVCLYFIGIKRHLLMATGGLLLYGLGSLFFFSTLWACIIIFGLMFSLVLGKYITPHFFKRISLGLVVVMLFNAALDWRLFYSQLIAGDLLHRSMWGAEHLYNYRWLELPKLVFKQIFFGHYHFWTGLQGLVIAILLAFPFAIRNKKSTYLILILVGFVILASTLSFIRDLDITQSWVLRSSFGSLNPRFTAVIPTLLLLLFAVGIKYLLPGLKKALIPLLVLGVLCNLFCVPYFHKDFRQIQWSENLFAQSFSTSNSQSHSAWSEFYMTRGFHKMKKSVVNADSITLACLNFRPEIARYHGFKTVGAYLATIDLEAYNEVRNAVGTENQKNLKNYLSRAYINFDSDSIEETIRALEVFDLDYLCWKKEKEGNLKLPNFLESSNFLDFGDFLLFSPPL